MTQKNRVKILEAIAKRRRKNKFLCVIDHTRREPVKGFKVEFANKIGPAFVFKTRKELDDFGARPDVSLAILEVNYTQQPARREVEL